MKISQVIILTFSFLFVSSLAFGQYAEAIQRKAYEPIAQAGQDTLHGVYIELAHEDRKGEFRVLSNITIAREWNEKTYILRSIDETANFLLVFNRKNSMVSPKGYVTCNYYKESLPFTSVWIDTKPIKKRTNAMEIRTFPSLDDGLFMSDIKAKTPLDFHMKSWEIQRFSE